MKKIVIDKNESVGEVIDSISTNPENELVLVFPRNTKFRDSASNFNLLRREIEATGKHVVIESVDEDVLAMAEASGLEHLHPLFSGGRSRSLSDIRLADGVPPEIDDKKKKGKKEVKKPIKKVSLNVPPPEVEESEDESEPEVDSVEAPAPVPFHHLTAEPVIEEEYSGEVPEREEEPETDEAEEDDEEEEREEPFEPEYRRPRSRFVPILLVILLLAAGGVWIATAFFAKANVNIDFRKTPWQYEGDVLASKNLTDVNSAKQNIPGEVFKDQRNITQQFPATGKAVVNDKAAGTITIYNAYSSSPQPLVATTRFQTPDGKVYRLAKAVTVPGAQIKDGKIIPSSIQAEVAADKAGPEYNVGKVDKLTIPGFQGTPKFEAFYGALENGAKGGFIGEKAVPTESDIATAKQKTTDILKQSLETNLLSKRPSDFKILDGATKVDVANLTVNTQTDDSGNFSVFGEAKFAAIGFRESDVKNLLQDQVQTDHPNYVFQDLNLNYTVKNADLDKGELSFTVSASGNLAPSFAPDQFKSGLQGVDVASAHDKISKLQDLQEANITLWPFWLRHVPQNANRIYLNVNYR